MTVNYTFSITFRFTVPHKIFIDLRTLYTQRIWNYLLNATSSTEQHARKISCLLKKKGCKKKDNFFP